MSEGWAGFPCLGPRRHASGVACTYVVAMLAACAPEPGTAPVEPAVVRLVKPSIPREALAALVDTVLAGSPEAKRTAADSLDRLADARTPTILVERLRDPAVRHEANRALARLSLASGLDSLAFAFADTSAFVRWSVATAFGAQGTPNARPSLVGLLDDTSMVVRRAAALSLGHLGDTTSLSALIEHRHDPDEEVRAAIAEALGQMGPQASPFLRTMVEDDSGLAVASSLRALGRLGLTEMVPVIGVALLDGSISTRMAACEALGHVGSPTADSLLLAAALDDPEPLVREAAVQAFLHSDPALVLIVYRARGSRETDAFVRGAWVDVLDRVPGEPAEEALRHLSEEDPSPDVRHAAREALSFRSSRR